MVKGFLLTFKAVLDDLPALGGLQGLPGLRPNLPVAGGVLYGLVCLVCLVCPFSEEDKQINQSLLTMAKNAEILAGLESMSTCHPVERIAASVPPLPPLQSLLWAI